MVHPGEHEISISGCCTAYNIQWLINGTLLEDLGLANVTSSFMRRCGTGGNWSCGIIHFLDLTVEFNNTCVQSKLIRDNGEAVIDTFTILVQVQEEQ